MFTDAHSVHSAHMGTDVRCAHCIRVLACGCSAGMVMMEYGAARLERHRDSGVHDDWFQPGIIICFLGFTCRVVMPLVWQPARQHHTSASILVIDDLLCNGFQAYRAVIVPHGVMVLDWDTGHGCLIPVDEDET